MREPRWDRDWDIGRQGEIFCEDTIKALIAGAPYETKHDLRAADTGNIYVEYSCKRNGSWQKSGLATTMADYWMFVFGGGCALVVPTFVLRALSKRAWEAGKRVEETHGSHPTKGVIIPLRDILRWVHEGNEERAA